MKQPQNLYQYLYQTLVSQLLNGTFFQGQEFPSQREICLQYNVGITTVRKVMKMLDEQGYVRTAQGQPSIVTYQASKETHAALLVRHQEEIADAYGGLGLIMPVLYCEGAKRCTEPELRLLHKILDGISDRMVLEDHYRLANAFFTALLRPFNNQLIMDLELDSENYLHVPHIPLPGVENPFATTVDRTKSWFQTAVRQIEQKRFDEFRDGAAQLYRASAERVDRYLCDLGKYASSGAQSTEEIRWFRTKERSELYSRLAMTIIRRLIAGEFDDKKYLPSIPMLMEEYGVTKNTARRAVALLNALGFAQTIDKKGTVISTDRSAQVKANFNLADPLIQERVSLCLNALQIVSLTAHSCAASVTSVSGELALLLEHRLSSTPVDKFITLSFQLLINSFIQLMPYHSLQNIFRQLDDLILWGHYLRPIDESYYIDYSNVAAAMSTVVAALKRQDCSSLPDAFSGAFSLYYQNVCSITSRLPYPHKID